MKPYLKTVYRQVDTHVDTDTGEIIEVVEHKQQLLVSKEQFFITYGHIIASLVELQGNDIKFLIYVMFKKADPDGEFTNTKEFRDKATAATGLSSSTILRSLRNLTEQKVLFRGTSRSNYSINPMYFWKGEAAVRKQKLKYLLDIEAI